jgi:hypothetical protein
MCTDIGGAVDLLGLDWPSADEHPCHSNKASNTNKGRKWERGAFHDSCILSDYLEIGPKSPKNAETWTGSRRQMMCLSQPEESSIRTHAVGPTNA